MTSRNRNKAVLTVRPVWVTNGCRSAVIATLCSCLSMLQFRLGMDWLCRSTKRKCLSFAPASDITPAFLLLLLLLLLLATAAGASVAAAAAAALFVGSARRFIFDSNSLYDGGCCTEPSEK